MTTLNRIAAVLASQSPADKIAGGLFIALAPAMFLALWVVLP